MVKNIGFIVDRYDYAATDSNQVNTYAVDPPVDRYRRLKVIRFIVNII